MEQLREAAKRFMSEMARNTQPDANAQDQNLQAQDLDKLLDKMEDTARNGSREDAQAMLDQMQEMFENMRSARDGEESPGEREMKKQIGELEKLLRDQQALRDDTFRSDQRDHARKRAHKQRAPQGDDGQQAQPNEDGSNAPDEGDNDADSSAKPDQDQADQDALPLDERQGALRDRLAELQRKLKSLGMKGEKGFDDAQGDMKEAEGDLSGDQGKPGKDGQGGKGSGRQVRQGRGGRRARPRARGAAGRGAGAPEADAGPRPGSGAQRQGQLCRPARPAGRTARRRSARPRRRGRQGPRGWAAQGDRGRSRTRAPGHGGAPPPPRRPRPPGRRTRLSRTADEAGLRARLRAIKLFRDVEMISKRMEVFSKPWGKENPRQRKENPNFSLPRIEPFQRVKPRPG